ncbi:MAG: hypothetical protein JSV85_06740 [Candidatus Bathyarchaeota archaeon]|nr:MAG: hypothetical protein JSV85_06740 [Candidatus Bathyarchaeota archaeon]
MGKYMNQQFGSGVGTLQSIRWKELVKRWKSIDALGFDSVWVADVYTWRF